MIEMMIKMFRQSGVSIKKSSEYYVSELNSALYKSLKQGDIGAEQKKGLGNLFKAFALMDADFDDGSNQIESLRDCIGEELFEDYKKRYPDKYERLRQTTKQQDMRLPRYLDLSHSE